MGPHLPTSLEKFVHVTVTRTDACWVIPCLYEAWSSAGMLLTAKLVIVLKSLWLLLISIGFRWLPWPTASREIFVMYYILRAGRGTGLTHWGRVTHTCVGKLTILGSDNGLSPGRRQAIIWTNAGILLIGPLGTNVSEIFIGIQTFSFKEMRLKMSAKWRPFCLCLNELKDRTQSDSENDVCTG